MAEENVSVMARLHAERLMRGDAVSETEMRVIIAGLMLSVDKLANAFESMQHALWSEEKMHAMISEEVKRHCSENRHLCVEAKKEEVRKDEDSDESRKGFIAWLARLIRSIFVG